MPTPLSPAYCKAIEGAIGIIRDARLDFADKDGPVWQFLNDAEVHLQAVHHVEFAPDWKELRHV